MGVARISTCPARGLCGLRIGLKLIYHSLIIRLAWISMDYCGLARISKDLHSMCTQGAWTSMYEHGLAFD